MFRVATVALGCFIVAASAIVYSTHHEARKGNERAAERVAKSLELQILRINATLDVWERFPDWDSVIEQIKEPGQCIKYVSESGGLNRSNCSGLAPANVPPNWMTAVSRAVLEPGTRVERILSYRDATHGKLLVTTTPRALAASVWDQLVGLLLLAGLTIGSVCLLIYWTILRALRPVGEVLTGLNELGLGNLEHRLPNFTLSELQRISGAFNLLAEKLDRSNKDRSALARKLVDAQEQERRRLSRELHDELAQDLSALSAVAASIEVTAKDQCPALAAESRSLGRAAIGMMRTLRATMRNLRPQEIDDLGLISSLKSLVATYQVAAGPRTKYGLETSGDVDHLPPTISAHIYRIFQEGLTNISKHAEARSARLLLARRTKGIAASDWLELMIQDDGKGYDVEVKDFDGDGGLGLVGVRERVVALGGELDIQTGEREGFLLRARIPLS